jgi:hypothetical protein
MNKICCLILIFLVGCSEQKISKPYTPKELVQYRQNLTENTVVVVEGVISEKYQTEGPANSKHNAVDLYVDDDTTIQCWFEDYTEEFSVLKVGDKVKIEGSYEGFHRPSTPLPGFPSWLRLTHCSLE